MATRAFVDANIDSFWSGLPPAARPSSHDPHRHRHGSSGRDTLARRSPPLAAAATTVVTRGGGYSNGVPPVPIQQTQACSSSAVPVSSRGRQVPPLPASALGGGAAELGRRAAADEAVAEFKNVAVEMRGREGYNADAVNGTWRFWRVRGGRLSFRRDITFDDEEASDGNAEEEQVGGSSPSCSPPPARSTATTIRLFLFYDKDVDAWLISDAADLSGNVVADCGPVAGDRDFQEPWRIWDGSVWKQDHNVRAEVLFGNPAPSGLRGLRVDRTAPKNTANRSQSQGARSTPSPSEPRPPSNAPERTGRRPPNTARVHMASTSVTAAAHSMVGGPMVRGPPLSAR